MKLTRPHRKAVEELLEDRFRTAYSRAMEIQERAISEAREQAIQDLAVRVGHKDLRKLRRTAQALEECRVSIAQRLSISRDDAWMLGRDPEGNGLANLPRDLLERVAPSYVEEQKRISERRSQVTKELQDLAKQARENILLSCETTDDAAGQLKAFEAIAEEVLRKQEGQ